MVKLSIIRGNITKYFDITPETHRRLRLYLWHTNASLSHFADLVYEKFNDISEEIILRYLDEADPQ